MSISIFANLHFGFLIIFILISFVALAYSADHIVEAAINISQKYSIPKVIIGATIMSLGTTLPEVCVSVMAALQGKSSIALGNAVGSVICDTGLILGIVCLISKVPVSSSLNQKQGWLQLIAGVLLVIACTPSFNWEQLTTNGGYFSKTIGWVFLVLLGGYLYLNLHWSKSNKSTVQLHKSKENVNPLVFKLILMFILLALSSEILILSATQIAQRLHIPDSIVAITAIALGTSLPELSSAITSVRKGHAELALGNIIGADILNILFVAGSAAAFSPNGLKVDPIFFTRMFPIMLALLFTLRIGLFVSKKHFNKFFAFLLVAIYCLITTLNFFSVVNFP
jgi:cation:H+ antiporter